MRQHNARTDRRANDATRKEVRCRRHTKRDTVQTNDKLVLEYWARPPTTSNRPMVSSESYSHPYGCGNCGYIECDARSRGTLLSACMYVYIDSRPSTRSSRKSDCLHKRIRRLQGHGRHQSAIRDFEHNWKISRDSSLLFFFIVN